MARFLTLLSAIFVAATAAQASSLPKLNVSDVAAVTFWTDINFAGQNATSEVVVPSGCIQAVPPFVSSVSSVAIQPGFQCTLWAIPQCGLGAGNSITLHDKVPNLVDLAFNDLMVAYQCMKA
ncbi:hypothetical protein C8F01DRAFT_1244141 [Mycena amicta]|nr:hypothetical protein C8F01DRAFT_1244141 [Mycena amicta]